MVRTLIRLSSRALFGNKPQYDNYDVQGEVEDISDTWYGYMTLNIWRRGRSSGYGLRILQCLSITSTFPCLFIYGISYISTFLLNVNRFKYMQNVSSESGLQHLWKSCTMNNSSVWNKHPISRIRNSSLPQKLWVTIFWERKELPNFQWHIRFSKQFRKLC